MCRSARPRWRIGTVIGALFAGIPADRFGRKNVLFAIGALYFVSAPPAGLAVGPVRSPMCRSARPRWRPPRRVLPRTGRLAQTLSETIAWRWMFLVEAAPALVFFLLVFTLPELHEPHQPASQSGR
jgi:SP family xylose:H+ symportor-like MFS transporter